MVSAREIFMGFSTYYNSLGIAWEESLSTHTGRLLSYFDTLGRMLGYRVDSEVTLKKLAPFCPKDVQREKVDMIWWRSVDDATRELELAVESQQDPKLQLIKKDIRKLAIIPANLKVLYCAPKELTKILEAIRKEMQQYKHNQSRFLAIMDPWRSPDTFAKGTVLGLSLDSNGKIKGEGTAKVSKVDVGRSLSIRMFLEAKWKDK
ncbi:hypothetical protein E3J74_03550 [Candidatus Bathyarchaeota archaeon]|nr:MAG: hypothetical protein E3J74_03550 [Candidatus Bathyarchaeota archaeon]